MTTELTRAGAKFVHDPDAVLRSLPLSAWEPLFGSVKLLGQQFNGPASGETIAKGRTDFSSYWEFLFATTDPERRLDVRVEPFGGRVMWAALVSKDFELK